MREAQQEQRRLDSEIDRIAARLIREEGIPLWDAIERAKRVVQEHRQTIGTARNAVDREFDFALERSR